MFVIAVSSVQAQVSATQTITIDATGDARQLQVEVVRTQAAQARGLMFRQAIGADGMLFLYEKPQVAGMWMKNTLIPLDILFIDANHRVVKILRSAKPCSETIISSIQPVVAVLEIAAGNAAKWGVGIDDVIRLP